VKGAKAKEIITPVIEERRKAREESAARGEPPTFYNDAIEWLEEESKGVSYDAAVTQLSLSMAAIHTTSDLLTETLLRLARRPGLVEELRKEITDVLQAEGWKKTSLYNMKLLDSVIKESQRLRPISMGKYFSTPDLIWQPPCWRRSAI
jgi:cytochrome P450 monooxygenase-2